MARRKYSTRWERKEHAISGIAPVRLPSWWRAFDAALDRYMREHGIWNGSYRAEELNVLRKGKS